MFRKTRQLWRDTALDSAIEGVLREASKGNALEVQRWFNKLKDDCISQSEKTGEQPESIEERAFQRMSPNVTAEYTAIVAKLSQPGQVLEEVISWREQRGLYV
jgi:hypothetical protein